MLHWILMLFDAPIPRWGCAVVVGLLVAGCGGVHHLSVQTPLAPEGLERPISFRQDGYTWVLDFVDVEISGGPVVLSEELEWIIGPLIMIPAFLWEEDVPRDGPLEITLIVKARSGASVAFDPREVSVLLEDGRILSPTGVASWPSSPEVMSLGPIQLSGDEEWRASLQYGVSRVDLKPFTLWLGVLIVNGRVMQIPALFFEPGSLWQSS